jgi:glutamyl-Q tRNA(Asp) synthetase
MTQHTYTDYIGRFAPSPSGPLHLGSLVAALGSWLDARHYGGTWLVRIEDLDTPRNQPDAEEQILQALEVHGLVWDDRVIRQSDRLSLYQAALEQLNLDEYIFDCACSRREIEEQGGIYPGTCRMGIPEGKVGRAIRIRCPNICIQFEDRGFGKQSEWIASSTGDFVLKRADGVYSYQLAVVVDDIQQNINHIVRGADLLSSTPRQLFLYSALHAPVPSYLHLPLVMNSDGQKLSKQNLAPALNLDTPVQNILLALHELQAALNTPYQEAPTDSLNALLDWAVAHWQIPIHNRTQQIWGAQQSELGHDSTLFNPLIDASSL